MVADLGPTEREFARLDEVGGSEREWQSARRGSHRVMSRLAAACGYQEDQRGGGQETGCHGDELPPWGMEPRIVAHDFGCAVLTARSRTGRDCREQNTNYELENHTDMVARDHTHGEQPAAIGHRSPRTTHAAPAGMAAGASGYLNHTVTSPSSIQTGAGPDQGGRL